MQHKLTSNYLKTCWRKIKNTFAKNSTADCQRKEREFLVRSIWQGNYGSYLLHIANFTQKLLRYRKNSTGRLKGNSVWFREIYSSFSGLCPICKMRRCKIQNEKWSTQHIKCYQATSGIKLCQVKIFFKWSPTNVFDKLPTWSCSNPLPFVSIGKCINIKSGYNSW